jgi:DNA-binding transcriptional LysR family regulator
MELRQLEYLVAVAGEANFTRAAERVRISQSGVSAQVRQLERDLGATLFDRSARAVTLTSAGEAAVTHAREILAAAASMRQAVGQVTGVVTGELTVGMVTACSVTGLFEALEAFHRAHPGVAIRVREDDSAALAGQVRTGAADVALIGAGGAVPPGLESHTLVSERLVAVQSRHNFAERPVVSLPDLAAARLICLPVGTGVRAVFDAACAARGVRPDIAFEASAPGTVADLAARGLGVAILTESMAAAYGARPPDGVGPGPDGDGPHGVSPGPDGGGGGPGPDGDGLAARLIADIEGPAVLALVWRAVPSPAAEAFLRCCRAAFADGR